MTTISIHKTLVPIDFSDYSKNSLRYAVNFAEKFNSEIILLYVVEPILYPTDLTLGQIVLPSIDIDLEARAREELEKLVNTEIRPEQKVKTLIKSGKPYIEIIETAKDEDVDLIIISTHGHSGIEQVLFGSTTDKVVRKAPCPVLTLREPLKGFDFKNNLK